MEKKWFKHIFSYHSGDQTSRAKHMGSRPRNQGNWFLLNAPDGVDVGSLFLGVDSGPHPLTCGHVPQISVSSIFLSPSPSSGHLVRKEASKSFGPQIRPKRN